MGVDVKFSLQKFKAKFDAMGQMRRFELRPVTSGLPLSTDILGDRRHVSNVPDSDSTPQQATSLFDHLVGKAYPTPWPPMHSAMNSRRFIRSPHALLADLATDDIAEQFPTLALEFPELKLLDRSEVSRAGVDRDAGQEPFQLQTLDASGLLHDICAGNIVAAFFENINHRLGNIVASHYSEVLTITLREIFHKKGVKVPDTCIIFPLWVCRIFRIICGYYVLAVFYSSGLHHGSR
jgi:hypothetical protein